MVSWLPFSYLSQTVVSKGPRRSTRIYSWTSFVISATQNCNVHFNAKDTILYVSSSFLDLAIANLEFAYDTLQNSQNTHRFNLKSPIQPTVHIQILLDHKTETVDCNKFLELCLDARPTWKHVEDPSEKLKMKMRFSCAFWGGCGSGGRAHHLLISSWWFNPQDSPVCVPKYP